MRFRLGRSAFLLTSLLAVASMACAPKHGAGAGGPRRAADVQGGDPFTFRPGSPERDEPDAKKDEDAPKWDVQNPPGPRTKVSLDVDEGTWMSLDVSPDGKSVVFDLLGDLYRLPIEGGTAESLTHGFAWDMQPRFSPDGKWIAFTSDRGGGDNVWIMPAQGGDPRQITDEDFRLVNSPAWSPDGQYLAVRKHFTASRSLGAGELWLYHVSGGKGLQLTEKPNDQKDVGEPAFSPDGRYVYFSQDTTPGKVFEYNKDPHAGIYSILRLDREEGRTQTLISGPGGAVRPTPSPDGKYLAYVGRSGLHTTLFLHDLKSGARRALYHDLDRDMQETWAIHGVYPQIAWTPDSKSLVFWSGGKLERIDVESTEVTDIAFRVQDEREVLEALRFPVEVHPDSFHTKMLRWVTVAPDGRSVVFQALGHLWVRTLPDGPVRRLTRDDDVFEFHPSWSRDGRFIVYTAWNDARFGSVRVVPVRGGRSRTVTSEPGHYVEPTFSPDGRSIVFRKVRGGGLRSEQWSHDPGLYVVSSRGGTPELVTRDGSEPHFGNAPERVFFFDTESKGEDTLYSLKSISLRGTDPRTHVQSKNATEYRVSPDGRWLAFRERYNAHIAPFVATGKPWSIAGKSEAVPVTKVSEVAGEYIHWSGDARRLFWSLGPELFAQDVERAFTFLEGGPPDEPAPVSEGIDIGFDALSYRPEGTLALVGARIVTMKGDEVIDDGTIVVERDRIAAIGPSDQVEIPEKARRIDVSGKTIIPGLIDVHAHGPQGADGIIPQQNWLHFAELAFGVTTVHDPSNDTGTIFAAAELARAGEVIAPRIFSTGTILYGAQTPFMAVIEDLDDARSHLRRMKAVGAFSVKSYNQPRRNQRQQVIAAARELEMMVVPEGGSLYHHDMTMVVDGHTGVEHSIPVAEGYQDMISLWAGTKVGYTPTLVVGYGGLWGENYWYAHTNVFEHERLRSFVPPDAYEGRSRRRILASRGDWNHFDIAQLCNELLDAGVSVQLGAHGQREGLAAHWELWMFVQGGMTPHEALRVGTLQGAYYVGLDRDLGSLEPGKLADLVVIDGNPLKDIRDSEKITHTMVGGRLFDAQTMHELAGEERQRQPFYWERPGG